MGRWNNKKLKIYELIINNILPKKCTFILIKIIIILIKHHNKLLYDWKIKVYISINDIFKFNYYIHYIYYIIFEIQNC